MKALLILFFSLPLLGFTADYSIEKVADKFFIGQGQQKWELKSQAQEPKVIDVKKINDQFDLVIYKSEEAGTKYIIQMDKAVIIDSKNKKLITKEPLDYQYTNLQTKEVEAKASYQITEKKMTWKFEDEETIISLEASSN